MRNLLITSLTTCAVVSFVNYSHAADVIYDPAPVPPAPVVEETYDWTGAYIGIFGGAATGDVDYDLGVTGLINLNVGASNSAGGLFGGAQAGFDYQMGSIVLGAVADIAASDIDSELSVSLGGLGSATAKSELKYLGTVRARLGYAMDRFMVYGHGGFAYGETEQSLSVTGLGTLTNDNNDTKTGYVVGAGLEYAAFDNISFQTEYSYVDLGTDSIFSQSFGGGALNLNLDESLDFHTVKASINYRF
ncbi:outer membrane protein [Jiella marina]|uniref:outer membrane protein n=1 Tax=Jiella sp. LLJ827 TaxID=2917712 RepID=UPI00210116D6|nr:outer membrane beta-barrel protein [Jiella sp. LLJ827]MCQ0988401.1 outer membrane beta-barrel protein [Jiella sp. LLJ827]